MSFPNLAENLRRVRDDIAQIQNTEGLRNDVRIVAVTKSHPASAVHAARDAGLSEVGENRVQEAVEKQAETSGLDIHWHLIGHLQTNKAKMVPGAFVLVHSVDSWKVAEALAEAATKKGTGRLAVLLQVNMAGEAQKSGCDPAAAGDLARRIVGEPSLELRGLMTMAPFTDDERIQRRVFADARRLRDTLASSGVALPELSMGMSGDYRSAVAEGATLLRLGTILFGERQ